jgi:hypothetical protein
VAAGWRDDSAALVCAHQILPASSSIFVRAVASAQFSALKLGLSARLRSASRRFSKLQSVRPP